jgi:hypothetical protein
MNLPLKRSRRYWLIGLLVATVLFVLWQVPRTPIWVALLIVASMMLLVFIDLFPQYFVRYDLTDTALTARVFWLEYRFPKDEYTFEIGPTQGFALRTFGVGLGNFNYGHYIIGERPVFVIGSSLSGDVLFVSNGAKTFVLTPDVQAWQNG